MAAADAAVGVVPSADVDLQSSAWFYELLPPQELPVLNLSLSLKSRFLSRRAMNRVDRLIRHRKLLGATAWIANAGYLVMLLKPRSIGCVTAVLAFACWIPISISGASRLELANMQLRTRNQFVVRARSSSAERRHALALYVHVREQDVDHFNGTADQETKSEGGSVNYVEHVLELLDTDSDFEAVVRELDAMRPAEQSAKSIKSALAMKNVASPLVQAQWRVIDESQRGVTNVLQRTHLSRRECFSRQEAEAASSKRKQTAEPASDEVYSGGMYAPVPMRKLAVELWLYPPHVTIPSTGDRIPANSHCETDFFQDDGDAS